MSICKEELVSWTPICVNEEDGISYRRENITSRNVSAHFITIGSLFNNHNNTSRITIAHCLQKTLRTKLAERQSTQCVETRTGGTQACSQLWGSSNAPPEPPWVWPCCEPKKDNSACGEDMPEPGI